MIKKLSRDAFIVMLITGGILVSVELAVRIFSQQVTRTTFERGTALAEKDPILGHVNAPNIRAHFTAPEFSFDYSINTQGFRNPKIFTPEPAPGVVRMLLLGDSFTFGHGSQYKDIWPVILEERFAAEGKKVEIINAGVPGYSTTQQVLYLERLFDSYAPDIVVLTFVAHDLFTNNPIVQSSQGDIPDPKQSNAGQVIGIGKKSQLHSLILFKRALMSTDNMYKSLYLLTPRGDFFRKPEPRIFAEKMAITTSVIGRAYHYVRDRGKKFAVLSVPQLFQVLTIAIQESNNDAQSERIADEGIDVLRIDERLDAFASREGFLWIPTLKALAQTYASSGEEVFFRYDGHLNTLGNEVVAKVAFDGLRPLLEDW